MTLHASLQMAMHVLLKTDTCMSLLRHSHFFPDACHHYRWVLPAPYYNVSIGSGATAINLVVLETSTLIDGYLDPTSDYSMIDWQISQVGFASSAPSSVDLLYNLLKIPFMSLSM